MTIPILIIPIRTKIMLLKHYQLFSFFLVGDEKHRRSHWIGGQRGWGVYTIGRYMPRYT